MRRLTWSALTILLLGPTPVFAWDVTITGTGTWASGSSTTTYTAPGEPWSFAITVPNTPITPDVEEAVTSGSYKLNGSPVGSPVNGVAFFSITLLGLFDLFFTDGTTFELFGPQVYNSTTGLLIPGTYIGTSNPPSDLLSPQGIIDGTTIPTVQISTAAVPEPSTAFVAVFGAVSGMAYALVRKRRAQRLQAEAGNTQPPE